MFLFTTSNYLNLCKKKSLNKLQTRNTEFKMWVCTDYKKREKKLQFDLIHFLFVLLRNLRVIKMLMSLNGGRMRILKACQQCFLKSFGYSNFQQAYVQQGPCVFETDFKNKLYFSLSLLNCLFVFKRFQDFFFFWFES